MYTSHTPAAANGFKKWSSDHPKRSNDDNQLGPARPIVLTDPLTYGPNKPPVTVSATEDA